MSGVESYKKGAVLTSACHPNPVEKESERKPNIIILFVDELGYGCLGCAISEKNGL